MNEGMIELKNIHKLYRNGLKEIRALNGLDLRLEKGSRVGIVGPSGAGKSTLLHIMGGLDHPSSGKVLLNGIDIYKLSDADRARTRNVRVGFVFQFYHLLPEFTALENVMLPALMRGERIKDKPRDILKAVGLDGRMTHRPSELSGGESQRVAIARALVNEPELLLCDEPTGNLDSKTSESIYELLAGLKSKMNTTLVIVTHDENISKRVDKVIHLKDGRIS